MYVSKQQVLRILEDALCAVAASDRYMKWFEEEQERDYEEWAMQYDQKAKGLLRAYKYVTGRKVQRYELAIKSEIRLVKEVQRYELAIKSEIRLVKELPES